MAPNSISPAEPLDAVLDRYYAEHYDTVVHGGVGGKVQDWFHRAVEQRFTEADHFGTVLELGATSGEHLQFVRHGFDRYRMLDIRDSETAHRLCAEASAATGRDVQFVVGDAEDLAEVEDASVDRLISMCLLHHLKDPAAALGAWRRVVKPGGQLSIFLPCDPGALWRSGRALTTFRAARSRGYSDLQVRYINACDHRNHVASLRWMIAGVFQSDEVADRAYPLGGASWNLNLFQTFQIRKSAA